MTRSFPNLDFGKKELERYISPCTRTLQKRSLQRLGPANMRFLHGRSVLLLLLLILALTADDSQVAAARHRQQGKHGATKNRSHKKKAPKVIQLKELMYDLSCQDHELASSLDSSSCRGVGQHRQMYCPRNKGEDLSNLDTAAAKDSECKEAWVTVLADDAFLPGVLVLLHSIRQ
ncbi:hypothetical protein KFL_003780010, partial [Klebsormidium nitens]